MNTLITQPEFKILLSLVLSSIVLSAFMFFRLFKAISTKHEFNLPKQMDANKKVENILSELRALISASRISLIRFHNGSEFLPNNPIWKITSDNQVTADGVTHETIDGVLISRVQPIIEPVITGETSEAGIFIPDACQKCTRGAFCKSINSRTIRMDVDEMSGYSKMFLQKRGTKTAFMATLNNSNNEVFGVLMIEYTDSIESSKHEVLITQTICQFTEKLRFLFN